MTTETTHTATYKQVARPLRVLVPLIRDELAAGDAAALEHYRHAGEMLIEAKEQVSHGSWSRWLTKNFELSQTQARRYMRLARAATDAHEFKTTPEGRFRSIKDVIGERSARAAWQADIDTLRAQGGSKRAEQRRARTAANRHWLQGARDRVASRQRRLGRSHGAAQRGPRPVEAVRQMKSTPQIFRWLDQVKADRRLRASSDFKIAYQLSNRTNAAEFKKTGRLVTWQSVATLAAATGLSVRTVQREIRRLQTTGHLAVKVGGGRGRSNLYTLQTLSPVSPFSEAKPRHPCHPLDRETVTSVSGKGDTGVAKGCHPCHPNLSIKDLKNSPGDRDTEPERGSRRALTALDPLGAEICKAIGPDAFDAWFARGEAEIVEQTGDMITLAVKSRFFAQYIANQFEAVIARAAGVARADVVVRQTAAARSTP